MFLDAGMVLGCVLVVFSVVGQAACTTAALPIVNPSTAESNGTEAIKALVARRLPSRLQSAFIFSLNATLAAEDPSLPYDLFIVTNGDSHGQIVITSSTTSGLARGLLTYLRTIGHDITWSGDNFDSASRILPAVNSTITGGSWAQYRYAFNVVTYSYTTAFYSWEEWEYLLDWCALHGINFPLAIGGQEYVWREVYRDFGLSDEEIYAYLGGPAFESWQRMGNIQGAWPSPTPETWTNDQWTLQQKMVTRMVALGMTPILPAFAGFVPAGLPTIIGGPPPIVASQWENMPVEYTNDTALDPTYTSFAIVQNAFLKKQYELYGNWTSHYYSLDLFNELNPPSLDTTYLQNNTRSVVGSLRGADPEAIWVMQGWLFVSATYWNASTISALLSGAEDDEMIILDLASEALPAWNTTSDYYGKSWIYNTLHDYGQNQGLYGSLSHYASEPLRALSSSPTTLRGAGITMEGMNQNEIVYEFVLDSPWSSTALDPSSWTEAWISRRYSLVPGAECTASIYNAWQLLLSSAYNNTDFAVQGVVKSIFELIPAASGLTGRTGHHPTLLTYDPSDVVEAWDYLIEAVEQCAELLAVPAFTYDFVDVTRQVFANAFIPVYDDLIAAWNTSTPVLSNITAAGDILLSLLLDLDTVLSTDGNFLLYQRIDDARQWARNGSQLEYFEYQARNQITIWGPETTLPWALDRYASKQWNIVVKEFYASSWKTFISYLQTNGPAAYNTTAFLYDLRPVELDWQTAVYGQHPGEVSYPVGNVYGAIKAMQLKWEGIFASYYGQTL